MTRLGSTAHSARTTHHLCLVPSPTPGARIVMGPHTRQYARQGLVFVEATERELLSENDGRQKWGCLPVGDLERWRER